MATASAFPRPSRVGLLRAAFAVDTTLTLAFVYLLFTEASVGTPRYTVHGVAWVIVGLWILFDTDVASALTTTKCKTTVVIVGYFALLTVADGLVTSPMLGGASDIRVAFLLPGRGPALVYGSDLFNFVLMPTRVAGYATLAFLVYDAVVKTAGAAVSGIVGLSSCVPCLWPILTSITMNVFDGGITIATTVTTLSYDLSMLVSLITVPLLR